MSSAVMPACSITFAALFTTIFVANLNTALPSIRGLAKDLHISFITTKRAYEELEKEGFIYTVPAKGCYVSAKNTELIREANLRKIEDHMDEITKLAVSCNLSRNELIEMLDFSLEENRK